MTRFLTVAVALAMLAAASGFVNKASAGPGYAASGECYTDDGYNRFRPCGAGGD
jgi:hypothetical protein